MIDYTLFTGGLPRDAELRFTPNGKAVAEFTISQKDSRYDENTRQWTDSRAIYLDVTIWDEQATERRKNPTPWAHLAGELKQGDQVAVKGKLITRKWENREGEKRSKIELLATEFYVMPKPDSVAAAPQQASSAWNSQPPQQQQEPQQQPFAAGQDDQPPF